MSGRLLLAAPICEAFSVRWLRCRWSALQWPGSCVINETQICCRGAFSSLQAEMPSRFVMLVTQKQSSMSVGIRASFLAVW